MPAKRMFTLCATPERMLNLSGWVDKAEHPEEVEVMAGESVEELARRRCPVCATRGFHSAPCVQPRGRFLVVLQEGEPIQAWDRIILDTVALYSQSVPLTERNEPLMEVRLDKSVALSVAAARTKDPRTVVIDA